MDSGFVPIGVGEPEQLETGWVTRPAHQAWRHHPKATIPRKWATLSKVAHMA